MNLEEFDFLNVFKSHIPTNGVGTSNKRLMSLKQGLKFELYECKKALTGDSPTIARCVTQVESGLVRAKL